MRRTIRRKSTLFGRGPLRSSPSGAPTKPPTGVARAIPLDKVPCTAPCKLPCKLPCMGPGTVPCTGPCTVPCMPAGMPECMGPPCTPACSGTPP
eukprot:6199474-Pleurochrysis_carterae.AAC.3